MAGPVAGRAPVANDRRRQGWALNRPLTFLRETYDCQRSLNDSPHQCVAARMASGPRL